MTVDRQEFYERAAEALREWQRKRPGPQYPWIDQAATIALDASGLFDALDERDRRSDRLLQLAKEIHPAQLVSLLLRLNLQSSNPDSRDTCRACFADRPGEQ